MSAKLKDDKNRWRNKSVGFRVSPEEWDVINDKVRLCGYGKKQDYIMECLTNHKITAKGNPLMLTQFRADLRKMLAELERIDSIEPLDEAIEKELFVPIVTMLQILEAFKENSK
jgi:carbonic anhydrase